MFVFHLELTIPHKHELVAKILLMAEIKVNYYAI